MGSLDSLTTKHWCIACDTNENNSTWHSLVSSSELCSKSDSLLILQFCMKVNWLFTFSSVLHFRSSTQPQPVFLSSWWAHSYDLVQYKHHFSLVQNSPFADYCHPHRSSYAHRSELSEIWYDNSYNQLTDVQCILSRAQHTVRKGSFTRTTNME